MPVTHIYAYLWSTSRRYFLDYSKYSNTFNCVVASLVRHNEYLEPSPSKAMVSHKIQWWVYRVVGTINCLKLRQTFFCSNFPGIFNQSSRIKLEFDPDLPAIHPEYVVSLCPVNKVFPIMACNILKQKVSDHLKWVCHVESAIHHFYEK